MQCTGKPQAGLQEVGATADPKQQQPHATGARHRLGSAKTSQPYDGKGGIGREKRLPHLDPSCKP